MDGRPARPKSLFEKLREENSQRLFTGFTTFRHAPRLGLRRRISSIALGRCSVICALANLIARRKRCAIK
jgi:hypothetical protein